MKHMFTEVLVEGPSEIRTVQYLGADRLILARRVLEGGLSPELKTLDEALQMSRLPLSVLVKPDFLAFQYESERRKKFLSHLQAYRQAGVERVALTVTDHGSIDVLLLEEILSFGFKILFQNLDLTQHPLKTVRFLNMYPKVLQGVTRAQQTSGWEGKSAIQELVLECKPSFRILADTEGLTQHTLGEFLRITGVHGLQFGRQVRTPDARLDVVMLEQFLDLLQQRPLGSS